MPDTPDVMAGPNPEVPVSPNPDLPQGLSVGLAPQQTLPLPSQQQSVPAPQAPASPEAASHNVVGRAFGKILSGLSGGHTEYAVDPQSGRTVATQVKDPPGQTFRSILALGLMGGQGIGPAHGQYNFAQGLLAGLGGGAKEAQERNDTLDKRRRDQAQQDYANQLRASQEEREQKKLSMEEQLNRVAVADHNQNIAYRAQLAHQSAIEWNQRQGALKAAPLIHMAEIQTEADKPMVDGYKSLNIDPIVSGLTAEQMQKYIQDHPGVTTTQMGLHTGVQTVVDPETGEHKVESLYSIYPAMTKVPPSLIEVLKAEGADSPKNPLHNQYMSVLSAKDGQYDTRKILPIFRDLSNYDNLQKMAFDRRIKEGELAEKWAALDEHRLNSQLVRMKLKDENDKREAIDLYNKAFDPSTNSFRQDVMQQLSVPNRQPATKEEAKEFEDRNRKRDLLLAAVNGQIEGKTSELYDKYKPRKNEYGQLVFDDPAAQMQLDYLNTLKGASKQLLHPDQYAADKAMYAGITDPRVKTIVETLKGQNITDPGQILQSLQGVPAPFQQQVWKAMGINPPAAAEQQGPQPQNYIRQTLGPIGQALKDNPSVLIP